MPLITREQKSAEISSLAEKFGKAKAAFLVDYKGMTVEQVTNLRKKLGFESEMKVVRNTLAVRALENQPQSLEAMKEFFVGTNAIVFAYNDASASAKLLTDFAKDVEHLQVKSGLMDGKHLDANRVKALASLPSKDVLRAQLLGLMQAPAAQFVRTLNAVPSGFARLLQARHDQQAGGGAA
jgi:large subunit ribosomal protein L10